MDLELTWEKKALIAVGVIILIILIYAYGPFQSTPEVQIVNQTEQPSTVQTMPFPQPNSTNNTNDTNNTDFKITKEQAQRIAEEPGYTTGEPTQGTININNKEIQVWIVPLLKNEKVEKEVYVDAENGSIVATKQLQDNIQS
ncbi:MAG: peptidase [Methanobacteriaceae archaeon]|nr:peptidase [Methanobacteriaceae archaeon]